jgi:hypothetical protein
VQAQLHNQVVLRTCTQLHTLPATLETLGLSMREQLADSSMQHGPIDLCATPTNVHSAPGFKAPRQPPPACRASPQRMADQQRCHVLLWPIEKVHAVCTAGRAALIPIVCWCAAPCLTCRLDRLLPL